MFGAGHGQGYLWHRLFGDDEHGEKPVLGSEGVVTSLAWGMGGKLSYVLEGNINYTGAVMRWIVDDLGLLDSSKDAGPVAQGANPEDATYLVPAFTGLGAPYWKSSARALICGMGRGTGRAEIVKVAEESIAYQIADVIVGMRAGAGTEISELRVDGGPTRDRYLMQFQSDILGIPVAVPEREELSGIGAAYCAGLACGLYTKEIFTKTGCSRFSPQRDSCWREKK